MGSNGFRVVPNAGTAGVLANREVTATELPSGTWQRVAVRVTLNDSQTSLELRTYWYGTASLDIAAIRITQL